MITIHSPNKSIVYTDTEDHFQNGLLRLLSMDRNVFDKWLTLSEQSSKINTLDRLTDGFLELYPPALRKNYPVEPGPQDETGVLWYSSIAENPNFGIARSLDIAWLIREHNNKFVRETEPPVYEENYFEGDKIIAGGYGHYKEQACWRLEKAKRQVSELIDVTGLQSGYVLDVGSGYGYQRKALEDAGFKHEGIEISKHANVVSKHTYGFDSYQGQLSDHLDKFSNTFDVVVLGDVIEHMAYPQNLLRDIYTVLRPGGFVVIKTPNFDCPEAFMFGGRYHSLKREHLVYFTANSLVSYGNQVGFSQHKSTSISHLLNGFVGTEQTSEWARTLHGSDLVIYLKK